MMMTGIRNIKFKNVLTNTTDNIASAIPTIDEPPLFSCEKDIIYNTINDSKSLCEYILRIVKINEERRIIIYLPIPIALERIRRFHHIHYINLHDHIIGNCGRCSDFFLHHKYVNLMPCFVSSKFMNNNSNNKISNFIIIPQLNIFCYRKKIINDAFLHHFISIHILLYIIYKARQQPMVKLICALYLAKICETIYSFSADNKIPYFMRREHTSSIDQQTECLSKEIVFAHILRKSVLLKIVFDNERYPFHKQFQLLPRLIPRKKIIDLLFYGRQFSSPKIFKLFNIQEGNHYHYIPRKSIDTATNTTPPPPPTKILSSLMGNAPIFTWTSFISNKQKGLIESHFVGERRALSCRITISPSPEDHLTALCAGIYYKNVLFQSLKQRISFQQILLSIMLMSEDEDEDLCIYISPRFDAKDPNAYSTYVVYKIPPYFKLLQTKPNECQYIIEHLYQLDQTHVFFIDLGENFFAPIVRFPSIRPEVMTLLVKRIHTDVPFSTLQFPISLTPAYNADFDGDEVQFYLGRSVERILDHFKSSPMKHILTNENGELLIAPHNDALTYLTHFYNTEKDNEEHEYIKNTLLEISNGEYNHVTSLDKEDIHFFMTRIYMKRGSVVYILRLHEITQRANRKLQECYNLYQSQALFSDRPVNKHDDDIFFNFFDTGTRGGDANKTQLFDMIDAENFPFNFKGGIPDSYYLNLSEATRDGLVSAAVDVRNSGTLQKDIGASLRDFYISSTTGHVYHHQFPRLIITNKFGFTGSLPKENRFIAFMSNILDIIEKPERTALAMRLEIIRRRGADEKQPKHYILNDNTDDDFGIGKHTYMYITTNTTQSLLRSYHLLSQETNQLLLGSISELRRRLSGYAVANCKIKSQHFYTFILRHDLNELERWFKTQNITYNTMTSSEISTTSLRVFQIMRFFFIFSYHNDITTRNWEEILSEYIGISFTVHNQKPRGLGKQLKYLMNLFASCPFTFNDYFTFGIDSQFISYQLWGVKSQQLCILTQLFILSLTISTKYSFDYLKFITDLIIASPKYNLFNCRMLSGPLTEIICSRSTKALTNYSTRYDYLLTDVCDKIF
jgi:hypothetical protein